MIFTQRTVYLVFISAIITLSGLVDERLMWAGLSLSGLVLAAVILEWLLIPKKKSIECIRTFPVKFSFGSDHTIVIEVRNYSGYTLDIRVQDEPPQEFEIRDLKFETRLPNRKKERFEYHVCPRIRGEFSFNLLYALISFPFPGLIIRYYAYLEPSAVKVYPAFNEMDKQGLLTVRGRLHNTGVRAIRQIGTGTDYESLREYSPDDEYRRINWKATARFNRLTTTNYQVEKSQNVIIMLDSGRLMGTTAMGLSKLDHAVNAAMILSHKVIKNGDLAGLMIFSDAVHGFLQPKRGKTQIGQIADQLAVIQSDYHESNYFEAFETIESKCHRRSLIVLFSEIIDKDSSGWLINGILRLYPKHLCLCVLMRDPLMDEAIDRPTHTSDDAFRKAVAAEWLTEREECIAMLKTKGVLVIDAPHERMTPLLINEYLKIKMRSKL